MLKRALSMSRLQIPKIESQYSEMIQNVQRPLEISSIEWKSLTKNIWQKGSFWERNPIAFKVKKDLSQLKLSILVVPGGVDLLVFVNKESRLVGVGGQRKVKKAFSLRLKEMVAYKPLCKSEKKYFQRISKIDSLAIPFGIYTFLGKDGVPKTCGFEKLYNDNLPSALNFKLNLNEVLTIFHDCLYGLNKLHAKRTQNGMHYFHKDLKLGNILYHVSGETFWKSGIIDQVAIADFGLMNDVLHISGTLEYYSPEHAVMALRRENSRKWRRADLLEAFYVEHGRALDIWALGISFVKILQGQSLNCLVVEEREKLLTIIADLSQEVIDQELEEGARRFSRRPVRARLWQLAGKMLKVKPELRITAKDALRELKKIKE